MKGRQNYTRRETMHQFGVKSSLLDSAETTNKISGSASTYSQPLCPKPRRVGPAIPEFLKPLRCSKHRIDMSWGSDIGSPRCESYCQHNSDERTGILNMMTEEDLMFDGRDAVCTKCSPTCYSGSPPGRTHNPLVHDVQFLHQMELVSPFSRTKLSDKFGFTSASPV